MDNPFETQTGTHPSRTGQTLFHGAGLDKTVCEEKLTEQSAAPEQLSPSFLAACHCATDTAVLDQELEFLWEDGGAPGKFYEVYLGKISRNPVVRSKSSGKYFMLPWSLIIKLAVEEGIDK